MKINGKQSNITVNSPTKSINIQNSSSSINIKSSQPSTAINASTPRLFNLAVLWVDEFGNYFVDENAEYFSVVRS